MILSIVFILVLLVSLITLWLFYFCSRADARIIKNLNSTIINKDNQLASERGFNEALRVKNKLLKERLDMIEPLVPNRCGTCGRYAGKYPTIWEGRPQCQKCVNGRVSTAKKKD